MSAFVPAGMNSMSSMAAFTSERLASWLTLTANVRSTDLTKICISAGDFPGCSKKGNLSEQTAEKRTAWGGDHSSSSNCDISVFILGELCIFLFGNSPHLPPLHWISAKNLVKTKILISLEGKILSEGIFGFLGRAVFQSERIIEQSRIRLTEVFYFYSG